ncbi:MAG: serine hydrolase [Eubacteriales bacterium]
MDVIMQVKTVDLLIKFITGNFNKISAYDYFPTKGKFYPRKESDNFPRATPESQGIDSNDITGFLNSIEKKKISINNFVMLRHGKIVAEGSFAPYKKEYPQMLFSMSKSVVSTAIGMLIDEGALSLDEKIYDIFKEDAPPVTVIWQRKITVRHLLTMTSGIHFNEAGSVTDKDWVKAYLAHIPVSRPGKEFYYNSMNTYMLSAIVKKKTGKNVSEYLTKKLFEPLNIKDFTWEKSPKGIEKGGWGLSLNVLDIAKIGQLYLQNGQWDVNGKQTRLISEEWIREATSNHIDSDKEVVKDGYGYSIWGGPTIGSYQFNGAFGQHMVISPKRDMVIALTSGSQTMFTQGKASDLIKEFLGKSSFAPGIESIPENKEAYAKLKDTISKLRAVKFKDVKTQGEKKPEREIFRAAKTKYDDKAFSLSETRGGILPLVLQSLNINFSKGVSAAKFSFKRDSCFIQLNEGKDINVIKIGLNEKINYSDVSINGEVYTIGTIGKWFEENEEVVLKVFCFFIETPSVRIFKFIFKGDKLKIRFNERPSVLGSVNMLLELLEGPDSLYKKVMNEAISRKQLRKRVIGLVMPEAEGTLIQD